MFAWTLPADSTFTYGAWLGELLFYLLYRVGRISLILFVRTLLAVTAFGLVGYEARRRSGSWRLAAPAGSGVFTLPEWGGYVGWRLALEIRPFVDGRVELPLSAVWEEYLAIATGQPEWEARLQHWDLAYLLLSRERQALGVVGSGSQLAGIVRRRGDAVAGSALSQG